MRGLDCDWRLSSRFSSFPSYRYTNRLDRLGRDDTFTAGIVLCGCRWFTCCRLFRPTAVCISLDPLEHFRGPDEPDTSSITICCLFPALARSFLTLPNTKTTVVRSQSSNSASYSNRKHLEPSLYQFQLLTGISLEAGLKFDLPATTQTHCQITIKSFVRVCGWVEQ